ncbi:MAG: hypothetical protein WBP81_08205 [Solirubrobacteraceae bacterium]
MNEGHPHAHVHTPSLPAGEAPVRHASPGNSKLLGQVLRIDQHNQQRRGRDELGDMFGHRLDVLHVQPP